MEAGSTSLCEDDVANELFETAAAHVDTPKGVTAEHLSKVWRISHDDAKRTLEVTSQLNKQESDASLLRRFGTNDHMLRYKRIDAFFYTDTFFAKKVVSKRGYSMMQLFVSDKGFVKVYGIRSQKEFVDALKLFCKEVSAPRAMITDTSKSQKSNKSSSFLAKWGQRCES